MLILGIDIGGSGIKSCVVDAASGECVSERQRVNTPQPATPGAIIEVVCAMIKHFDWQGPVGCGFPGVIQGQKIKTAANLDKSCIGVSLSERVKAVAGNPIWTLNDADAAGVAELSFGAGKDRPGVSLLITIGTGLGSVFLIDGKFWLPNTELGHVLLDDQEAEALASAAVRNRENLSWKEWGARFNKVLYHYHRLFYPDTFILGGGIAKKFDLFKQYIDVDTSVITAQLLNNAGIVGAAMAAKIALDL